MSRLTFFLYTASLVASHCSAQDSDKEKKSDKKSPSCRSVDLEAPRDNAAALAESLNGIADGITARNIGRSIVLICGDNTAGAVDSLAAAVITKLGQATPVTMSPRESHAVKLYHVRDVVATAQVLQKAFPKLNVSTFGADTLMIGNPNGSDAQSVRDAKRWVALLDVPKAEVALNVWSVQVSSKNPETVAEQATEVRRKVGQHNQMLQDAIGRAYTFLVNKVRKGEAGGDTFFAKQFRDYLTKRYVIPSDPDDNKPENWGLQQSWREEICAPTKYCLGYDNLFQIQPTVISMLITVLAAKDSQIAGAFVDRLEGRSKDQSIPYLAYTSRHDERQQVSPKDRNLGLKQGTDRVPLHEFYTKMFRNPADLGRGEYPPGIASTCEAIATEAYKATLEKLNKDPANASPPNPMFPCLRAALSDAVEPVELGRIRMAMAHFLFHQKLRHHYPSDFDPGTAAGQRIDSIIAPILSSFSADMLSFLRSVRDDVAMSRARNHAEFASGGIVTLSTLSSMPSSVGTSTQNEFSVPSTLNLKELLANSVLPAPGTGKPEDAQASKLPSFLLANLTPGVTAALAAGLSMDSSPTVASLGRNLTLNVVSHSLPGSSAELNVNLTSQDEAPPTVVRGATSKPDYKSRVAKHNLQTNVRVDSLKLFELSTFSAELLRGGDSIPIIPPYIELPGIGSLARWPVKPSRVYHRSFAIISAVVLPTSADLASMVRPSPDLILDRVEPKLTMGARAGGTYSITYILEAHLQEGWSLQTTKEFKTMLPSSGSPIKLSWPAFRRGVRYSLYRSDGQGEPVVLLSRSDKLSFDDDGGRQNMKTITSLDMNRASGIMQITPMSFLWPSVEPFHMRMLDCIYEEAMRALEPPACSASLSNSPSIQPPR